MMENRTKRVPLLSRCCPRARATDVRRCRRTGSGEWVSTARDGEWKRERERADVRCIIRPATSRQHVPCPQFVVAHRRRHRRRRRRPLILAPVSLLSHPTAFPSFPSARSLALSLSLHKMPAFTGFRHEGLKPRSHCVRPFAAEHVAVPSSLVSCLLVSRTLCLRSVLLSPSHAYSPSVSVCHSRAAGRRGERRRDFTSRVSRLALSINCYCPCG